MLQVSSNIYFTYYMLKKTIYRAKRVSYYVTKNKTQIRAYRSIRVDFKHSVEYCMYDFTNFNDILLNKLGILVVGLYFLMRKSKQNLFFLNINFYFVQNIKNIRRYCICFKMSFEKFSVGNPNETFSREIIVV